MKAALALIIIYVGTFFVAIQGSSNNPAQAQNTSQQTQPAPSKAIDPAKEADIRSLLELIGARDMIQDAADSAVSQFREKISTSKPGSERAQNVADTFAASFQRKYDPDALMEQLVGIYDKHYTGEEIKGLLQFYGSPVGQKAAAEMPKITREIQAATRAISNQAAREAWQELKAENPGAAQGGRPLAGRRRAPLGQNQPRANYPQQAQSDPQQP
jgi:uncharacterized protein